LKSRIPVNVNGGSAHGGGNRWAPSSRAWRHVFSNISGDRSINERRGWVRSVEEWKNLSAARGRQTNPVTQYFASVTTLPMFPVSENFNQLSHLFSRPGRQSFIMLDCGIIRWEDVFPSHDGEEDPNSYHSTKAIKGHSPPSSSLTSSSPLCLPSVTMVDRRDYEMLQEHRNDLLAQLQSSLQEIKRLNTQSNLYRLEVEQLREERQRVRDALEGRETYF
jgi:hypothetical protein